MKTTFLLRLEFYPSGLFTPAYGLIYRYKNYIKETKYVPNYNETIKVIKTSCPNYNETIKVIKTSCQGQNFASLLGHSFLIQYFSGVLSRSRIIRNKCFSCFLLGS